MLFSPATDKHAITGWNGLQFSHPASWQVIVAAPHHLIVESNLSPILEIRWEPSGKSSVEQVIRAAINQLTDSTRSVIRLAPGDTFPGLDLSQMSGLSWHDNRSLDGLVWQCPVCATVLFLHLSSQQTDPVTVASLLQSLRCHKEPEEHSLWALQDFRLSLPPGYTYIDSTFAAGLSRLAFEGHDLRLQFCRLAPASARLAQSSLIALLKSMLDNRDHDEILNDSQLLCEIQTHPTAARRLVAHLSRKPIYRWGRIWHKQQQNRLLSLIIESRHPVNLDSAHHLAKRYEIV